MAAISGRAIGVAALAVVAFWFAGPAGAQAIRAGSPRPGSMGIPQPEPRITVSVRNRSLGFILNEIFKQAPYRYMLLAETGATVFSLEVRGEPLSRALTMLLEQDRSPEPLVFAFQKLPTGGGVFIINREYIDISSEGGANRVSLSNARLTRVLPEIFRRMRAEYRIEPDVPPVPVTLQLRPADWFEAFVQVLMAAAEVEPTLTYSMDGDTYVVHLHKIPLAAGPTPEAPARRVNLTLANTPLRDALARLFEGSAWKYQVSDAVRDTPVTCTIDSMPELAALVTILRYASANGPLVTYREGRGILYIEPGPLPGALPSALQRAGGTLRLTTREFKEQKLREVALFIAQDTRTTIRVAPDVPDLPLTFRVEKANAESALRELVRAAQGSLPNLTFRATGPNAYVLELKRN